MRKLGERKFKNMFIVSGSQFRIINKKNIFIKKKHQKHRRCSIAKGLSMPVLLENGIVLVIVYGAERYKKKVLQKIEKMEEKTQKLRKEELEIRKEQQ